jgi:hypothetical protein
VFLLPERLGRVRRRGVESLPIITADPTIGQDDVEVIW